MLDMLQPIFISKESKSYSKPTSQKRVVGGIWWMLDGGDGYMALARMAAAFGLYIK